MSSTLPKPFVFVLMPFDASFDDTYKFGIKGAAEEIGAYAERIDEQIFTEGILDRIFNQIAKADVIVADMTGRNPNVFYEVGYAHALGKIVLLLTRDSDDIPFDLKHHQHTIYEGSIDKLRRELVEKLRWGLEESKAKKALQSEDEHDSGYLELIVNNTRLHAAPVGVTGPTINRHESEASELLVLRVEFRNPMLQESPPARSSYLFCRPDSFLSPIRRAVDKMITVHSISHDIVGNSEAPDGLRAYTKMTNEVSAT